MSVVKYKYSELIPTAKYANVSIGVEVERECDEGSEVQTFGIISEAAETIVEQKRQEVLDDLNGDS